MRDDKARFRRSLETARQIGRAENDLRVEELRLKLRTRSGEYSKTDEPTHSRQD